MVRLIKSEKNWPYWDLKLSNRSQVLVLISPVGTIDNSPAIYRWETCSYIILVPQGRLKKSVPQGFSRFFS